MPPSLSAFSAEVAMPVIKDWGIYVYFAADVPSAQMGAGALENLKRLAAAGSNENIGITAMMDLPGKYTQFFVIPPKPKGQDTWRVLPDRWSPNLNSASTDTIFDFFAWSFRNCPAKHIALVFWGHGYAIDDFDPRLETADQSTDSDPDRDVEGCSGQSSADEFAQTRDIPLKFIFDSTHNSVLNNNEVADVIRRCNTILPGDRKVDVLGFDCCNMALAEVLCEMEDCANYAVAAETGLPFEAWISAKILQKFLSGKPPDPQEFAKAAVIEFIDSFADQTTEYVQLSACNLNKCVDLEAAMNKLSAALSDAADDPWRRAAIYQAWNNGVSFDPDGFIDLYCFCGLLSTYMSSATPANPAQFPSVVTAAKEVQGVLHGGKDPFVLVSKFAPNLPNRRIALSKGLAIWFPSWIQDPTVEFIQKKQSKEYFFNGYQRTRFATATGWNMFLLKLFNLTQGIGN
jgi:hypothetical protein